MPGSRPDSAAPGSIQTLPRTARLNASQDFNRVFERARRSSDRAFTVLVRPNGVGTARLGMAISKKCARRNVDRNRIKRVIRESFRRHRTRLPGSDYVVLCRPAACALSNAALLDALGRHWTKLSPPTGLAPE